MLYQYSWAPWRAAAKRIDDEDDRESFLSIYGPLSLLMLLVFWASMQVVGWGLVWWGMRNGIPTLESLIESIYYSGVAFFTIGFGDVVPIASAPRILVVLEGFFGVATMALLIGFLPTLFAAYSTREELVSTLDDLTGDRVTPIGMLERLHARWRRQRALLAVRAMGGVDRERAREPLQLSDADAVPIEAVGTVVDRGDGHRHRDGGAVHLHHRHAA